MIVVKPLEIDDTRFVSSNIAEDDAPEYIPANTYNTGSQVVYEHMLYECGADNTVGVVPTDKTKWIEISPTNQRAMFNYLWGTATTYSDDITVTINPLSRITSLALMDVYASSIIVTMTDATDGLVYSKTYNMADYGVLDWYEYFFTETSLIDQLIVVDLPPAYYNATITVTIKANGDTAKVGALFVGQQKKIGELEYGMSGGRTDYSSITRDDFGVYTIIERTSARTREFPIEIETAKIDSVEKFLDTLRAKPNLFIGSQTNNGTVVFGLYQDFDIVMSNVKTSTLSINVQGVI